MNKQRGLAMVELAILMPLLVMVVFGVTELGRALYQEQTLTKSAASAARFMARGFAALDGDCNPQGNWGAMETRARELAVFSGGDRPVVGSLTVDDVGISIHARSLEENVDVCVVRVDIVTPFAGIFGERLIPFVNIGRIQLSARAEEVFIGE